MQPIPITEVHIKPRPDSTPNFEGTDVWQAYEFSWLNAFGKPCIGLLQIELTAGSAHLIMPISLKAYLNSFNMVTFESMEALMNTLNDDFQTLLNAGSFTLALKLLKDCTDYTVRAPEGFCLDKLDESFNRYSLAPELLKISSSDVTQDQVYSQLMRFCCDQTGQPYWATVAIDYRGLRIQRASLLAYLISFRNERTSPENCAQRIIADLLSLDPHLKLTLVLKISRKGGLTLDIYRSNQNFVKDLSYRVAYQ